MNTTKPYRPVSASWLILCWLLFSTSFFAQSTRPNFDLITLEEGISNGFVTSIYQDKKGIMWFGTADGLNQYDGYTFRSFQSEPNQTESLSNNIIWALSGDDQGYLWIGTEMGLNRFDPAMEKFTRFLHHPEKDSSLSHNSVESIAQDTAGNIWVGTANGLNLKKKGTTGFARFFYRPHAGNLPIVKGLLSDQTGTMWIGMMDTLFQYQGGNTFAPIPLPLAQQKQANANYIRTIYEDTRHRIWIGTEANGLFVYDKFSREFTAHYHQNASKVNRISHNRITAILEDKSGAIWVASYGGGLNLINQNAETVEYFNATIPKSLEVTTIRSMYEDMAGNFWLGTSYEGLYLVKKHKKDFKSYSKKNSGLRGAVSGFQEDDQNQIWISSQIGGLMLFVPESESFLNISGTSNIATGLLSKNITSMTQDHKRQLWLAWIDGSLILFNPKTNTTKNIKLNGQGDRNDWLKTVYADHEGQIWIGFQTGICKYNPNNQKVITYPLIDPQLQGNNQSVEYFIEDRNHNIWIATHGGLNKFDRQKDTIFHYPSDFQVYAIYESSNGTLWVATSNGLAIFNRDKEAFQFYNHIIGLPKIPLSILEDTEQNLWIGARSGLYQFNPKNEKIINYNRKDGLINNQFLHSNFKTASGEMYFAGISGFTRFDPKNIKQNTYPPPVVITKFQLFNKEVPIRHSRLDTMSWSSPLETSVIYSSQIELQHWQNDISFEFAALDFTAPENNQYQYQLVGKDEEWIPTNAQRRFAHYTNLAPGEYVFQVKAANNDVVWNENLASIAITIFPPWWQTIWAYLVWIILVAGILYAIYVFQLKRKLTQAENQRLQELDILKTRLYTNITHEFRTPLTIILGISEQIKDQVSEHVKDNLQLIRRNGRHLLKLVNQMLDLSKLESGQLTLAYQQGDIINYLKYLMESFHSYAESKKIRLHFLTDLEEFYMDYDPTRIMHIVSNLLSNAIKFSPEGKDVYVHALVEPRPAGQVFTIKIKDTGIGIPKEKLSFIFDQFYQADNSSTRRGEGTGIGLTLVKELVHLMAGRIDVKSELGQGSEFRVILPVKRDYPIKKEGHKKPVPALSASRTEASSLDLQQNGDKPLMLIVEDNPDLVKYLVTFFNPIYHLEVAYNGQQGIEKAISLVPDIIITDVMMPQKDGFELCMAVKQHDMTSHIPIIMLTAKVDVASRLAGLKRGADAYLAKPFLPEELNIWITALLNQRRRLQAYYRSHLGLPKKYQFEVPDTEDTSKENTFLENVNCIIIEKLDNPNLNVEVLSADLFISVSNLYRKLKALTGLSPNQYIRSLRLARAKRLLKKPAYTIADVAYETGFSDPDYFTRVFKKEFGQTPSEFRHPIKA